MCDLSFYSREVRAEFFEELRAKPSMGLVERAYKFFYVNRTSINGIGGFSVTCNYIRRKMSKSVSDFLSSIDGLDAVHDRLSRVIIEKMDGLELIEKYDRNRVFMYLDPPYHHDTRTITRYKVDMDNDTQTKLIDKILSIKKAKVLLSGYDCQEYSRLSQNGWNKCDIIVNTIDGNRDPKVKTETLWWNYELAKEDVEEVVEKTVRKRRLKQETI